jgi:Helitron helicase-like domain at N-terminus
LPIWYDDGQPQYHVPDCLLQLTHAEKMLIQRVSPFVPLHHLKNGTFGISGHVCAFEQDISSMANILPRLNKDVTVIKVLQEIQTEIGNTAASTTRPFRVRRQNVLDALTWLKQYNKEYSDIVIDASRLDWIDGDEGELIGIELSAKDLKTNRDDDVTNADMGPCPSQALDPRQIGNDIQAFGYVDEGGPSELSDKDVAVTSTLKAAVANSPNRKDITIDWPATGGTPISEFDNIKIFARAFPWLFPGGYGDIKDYDSPDKQLTSWGRRLLYYEDARFAKDKIFCFFAMNYIIRHRNSTSGRFFIDNFQRNVPDTLPELQEQIKNGNTSFVNGLTYWNKRIKGSSPYWFQKRAELYTWINQHIELGHGPPTFFITLSCAEYFWADVIDLLRDRLQIANIDTSQCKEGSPQFIQLVNDYSIVIQEYFQKRTETWLETVGKVLFGIKHYWVRYEFAPGRGQIHAHLLAIPEDHDIYKACHEDMKKPDGKQKRAERMAAWAHDKFGLTASTTTDKTCNDHDNKDSPVTIRFSDLDDDDDQILEDGERLLHACETHTCSQFCLRAGNEHK